PPKPPPPPQHRSGDSGRRCCRSADPPCSHALPPVAAAGASSGCTNKGTGRGEGPVTPVPEAPHVRSSAGTAGQRPPASVKAAATAGMDAALKPVKAVMLAKADGRPPEETGSSAGRAADAGETTNVTVTAMVAVAAGAAAEEAVTAGMTQVASLDGKAVVEGESTAAEVASANPIALTGGLAAADAMSAPASGDVVGQPAAADPAPIYAVKFLPAAAVATASVNGGVDGGVGKRCNIVRSREQAHDRRAGDGGGKDVGVTGSDGETRQRGAPICREVSGLPRRSKRLHGEEMAAAEAASPIRSTAGVMEHGPADRQRQPQELTCKSGSGCGSKRVGGLDENAEIAIAAATLEKISGEVGPSAKQAMMAFAALAPAAAAASAEVTIPAEAPAPAKATALAEATAPAKAAVLEATTILEKVMVPAEEAPARTVAPAEAALKSGHALVGAKMVLKAPCGRQPLHGAITRYDVERAKYKWFVTFDDETAAANGKGEWGALEVNRTVWVTNRYRRPVLTLSLLPSEISVLEQFGAAAASVSNGGSGVGVKNSAGAVVPVSSIASAPATVRPAASISTVLCGDD
ncbi:hypothetical protein Vretimale_4212, partial [Volvox reticuliferus]